MSKNLSASKTITVQNQGALGNSSADGDWPYVKHQHTVRCPLLNASQTATRRFLSTLYNGGKGCGAEIELRVSVLLPKKLEVKERTALSVLISATPHYNPETAARGCSETITHSILVIKSFKLSLIQHTQVRAGCHTPSTDRRVFTRKGSCVVPVSRIALTPNASNPAQESNGDTPTTLVNLSDITDLTVPRDILVPDFSTYNIARSHTLELTFTMEYERKKFKFALRDVPIWVLPTAGEETETRRSREGDEWIVTPPPVEIEERFGDGTNANVAFEEPLPGYSVNPR